MKVKVCGIRDIENLHYLQQSDVDMIGFIFYDKSKRFFDGGNITAVDMLNVSKEKVGVFVNASIEEITTAVRKYSLSAVQLHGNETPEYCEIIRNEGVYLMKAFSVSDRLPDDLKDYEDSVDLVLFDTKGKEHGGNGVQFDWSVLEAYQLDKPFMVSGGVGPLDVAKLNKIKNEKMIGVDVNSRFEIAPGLKDESLLGQFIEELKR